MEVNRIEHQPSNEQKGGLARRHFVALCNRRPPRSLTSSRANNRYFQFVVELDHIELPFGPQLPQHGQPLLLIQPINTGIVILEHNGLFHPRVNTHPRRSGP